jgi:hypothetical protein
MKVAYGPIIGGFYKFHGNLVGVPILSSKFGVQSQLDFVVSPKFFAD